MHSLLSAILTLTDLIFKNRIEEIPKAELPRSTAGGYVVIDRFHNYGFPLSHGASHPDLVTSAVTAIYILFFGSIMLQKKRTSGSRLALARCLILSGGISNLLDRYRFGYVVDYLIFPRTPFRKLILNLGDLYLLAGCLLHAFGEASEDAK